MRGERRRREYGARRLDVVGPAEVEAARSLALAVCMWRVVRVLRQ